MALCDYHTISWIIFDLRESRLGLFFFFSSGMRKNNDLLLFFYPPLLLRSWRQQAFQSVSKCKAKAPGGTGPIFNLVEAQTRVNAPVALYRSIRTLGSPFERRNKSNMQQAYHGGQTPDPIQSPETADESPGIKWHQGEGEEDEDEISKWNCMDSTSLEYSITTIYHWLEKIDSCTRVRVSGGGYYNYGGKTGDERINSIRRGEPAECVI